MATIKYISKESGLYRTFVHPPFPGPIAARSVEQYFGYIMAIQAQKSSVAEQIIAQNSVFESDPGRICTFLELNEIGQNGPAVMMKKEVYMAIWLDQIEREYSPLRSALQPYVIVGEQEEVNRPYFAICNAGNDRVWGCGMTKAELKRYHLHDNRVAGHNVYGDEVLGAAYLKLAGISDVQPTWSLEQLLAGPVDLSAYHPKTILGVSDSMLKFGKHVDGGHIEIFGGGKFSDAHFYLRYKEDLAEYAVIVINFGVNVAQLRDDVMLELEFAELACMVTFLKEQCPNSLVVFGLPLRFDRRDGIPEFNQRVRQCLEGFDNVQYIETVEPFWNAELEQRRMEYYRTGRDQFHLNRKGTEILWSRFGIAVPMVKYVRMNIGNQPRQLDIRPGGRSAVAEGDWDPQEGTSSMHMEPKEPEVDPDTVLVVESASNDTREVLLEQDDVDEWFDNFILVENEPIDIDIDAEQIPEAEQHQADLIVIDELSEDEEDELVVMDEA